MKQLTGKGIFLLVTEGVAAILLLFGKWLGIDLYYASGYTGLFKFGKLISQLNGYVDGSALLVILAILVYGGLLVSLVAIGMSIYALFTGDKTRVLWGSYAPAAYSVFILLIVIIGNAAIKNETDGWITSIFAVTAVPFIVLALGVIGIIGYAKLPEKTFDNAQAAIQKAAVQAKAAVQKMDITCPKCGASCKNNSRFCANCGTELPQHIERFCAACGTKMPAQAKFCPSCGAAVAAAAEPVAEESALPTENDIQ